MKKIVLMVMAILTISITQTTSAQTQKVYFPLGNTPEIVAKGKTPTGQDIIIGFYFGEKTHILKNDKDGRHMLFIGWEKATVDGYDFPSDSLGNATMIIKEGDMRLAHTSKLHVPYFVRKIGALPGMKINPAEEKILTIEVTFKDTDYSTKQVTLVTPPFKWNFTTRKLEAVALPIEGGVGQPLLTKSK